MSDAQAKGRIDELLSAMTLEEKIGQLTMLSANLAVTGPGGVPDYVVAVREGRVGNLLNLFGADLVHEAQRIATRETRLGIPLLLGFDVIHGHRTAFPIPLGEAAAFDPDLWERTARAAAVEAAGDGLSLTFAPMLDVCRDPRWGRIAEGPGEDTWLTCRFGEAKVKGFQGLDLADANSIAANAKHLGAYGAVAGGREYAPVDVSERQLREVYFPPFRRAVQAGVATIMPSFNDLAGVPMSANVGILRDLLRRDWGFEGVIISDYSAIAELINHGVAADLVDAAALALRAGVDIDMMGFAYEKGLAQALARGSVEMADIDASVRRVLQLKQALGLFDDPLRRGRKPFVSADQRRAHRELAREAALRSMVLLTNAKGVLPVRGAPRRVALIGPLADAPAAMIGTWGALGDPAETTSFLLGFRAAWPATDIRHAAGVPITGDGPEDIAAALAAVRDADLVLLCLGEDGLMSGEGASRVRPDLPGRQAELARAVLDQGKPTVALLTAGRPLIVPWLFERADAVVMTWALGSEAGHAAADIVTGAVNPSGKLPVSWPLDVGQVPVFYAQRPTGRAAEPDNRYSARYIDAPVEPQFAFGHGLSYSRFRLDRLRVDRTELRPGEQLLVEAEVTNEGPRAGSETVLLFVRDPVACVARPLLELRGMARVELLPGASTSVTFTLDADALRFLDPDLRPCLEPGEIQIFVGPRADRRDLLQTSIQLLAG